MCYYTFLNEKLLQRYTFFMIYANLFAKKCGEATIFVLDRLTFACTELDEVGSGELGRQSFGDEALFFYA